MNHVYEVSDSKGKIIISARAALNAPEKAIEKLNKLFGTNSPICKNAVEPLFLREYSTFEWTDESGKSCWEINSLVRSKRLIANN